MLNQIIWTRCYPHRELQNKGQVNRADGFGVFSMSRELVEQPPVDSFDYLKNRMALQNGAKEGSKAGLFNSYEYNMLAENVHLLSYEVARPQCRELRKNGQSHRPGTFIKQSVIGELKDYPFSWFGADVWTAAEKGEPEYYLEETPGQEPDWLPMTADKASGGYITPEKIRDFVLDGRSECVKAGVWFLLDQYGKNESERKVLVIKDVPENVELWIAAMEYGLSPQLARTVTFATNRSKLGAQADNVLFYNADPSGRFSPAVGRKENMTRHAHAMIVGIHPLDQFANLKPLANSNFVMIDGTAKKTSIQPDQEINSAYYNALVKYDDDIIDFSTEVLSSLPVDSISRQIPAIYDAYMYLLDSRHSAEHWSYRSAVDALQTLFAEGVSDSDAICGYILNECMRAYTGFAEDDEKNNYTFLKIMWKLAVKLKRTQEVTGCLADRINAGISRLGSDPEMLIRSWSAIQNGGVYPVIRSALPDIFNDSELPDISKILMRSTPQAAETMMEMFMKMLSAEQGGVDTIRTDNAKFNFAAAVIFTCLKDRKILYKILNQLNQDADLMNEMALQISSYLEKNRPNEVDSWWDVVIDVSGGNVIKLCESICKSKTADIDMIENLLANRIIRSGHVDESILKAFTQARSLLKNKASTGVKLYTACIRISKTADFPDLIQKLSKADLSKAAQKTLAETLDSAIYNKQNIPETVYRKVNEMAVTAGSYSRSYILYEYAKRLGKCRNVREAMDYSSELAKRRIEMDGSLLTSDLFEVITKAGTDLCNGELHVRLLLLFIMDGTVVSKYINAYVAAVLEKAGRELPEVIVSFAEAGTGSYTARPYDDTSVKSVQKAVISALKKNLPDYYKPSLKERIDKIEKIDRDARKKLDDILSKIASEYKSNNPMDSIMSGLSGLFGKKGK